MRAVGHKTGGRALRAGAALLLCALLVLWPARVLAASSASDTNSGGGSAAQSGSADASASGADTPPEAPAPQPEGQSLYTLDGFAPNDIPFELKAEAACVYNVETGLFAFEKNADTPLTSASLVKMMTCILTAEAVEDLDATLILSDKTWIYDVLTQYRLDTGSMPSQADIRKGETLSVRELLYAALLPSANEAALILADYVSGTYMPNFLYMMNQRAKSLGCTGTVFADANGLSEENVTTARDMVRITEAFMSYPVLTEIAATARYEIAAHEKHAQPYYIHGTNRLIVPTSPYYNAFSASAGTVLAGKTGSLDDWQNFASMAKKGDETYICAVLHSPNSADAVGLALDPAQARPALYESAALYAWAFEALTVRPALDTSQPVTELRVLYASEADTVRLMPLGDVGALLPKDAENTAIQRRYNLPESLEAPVLEGQEVGSVTLLVGGREIGSATLVAAKSIERNSTLYLMGQVGAFFAGTFFRVLVALVLLAGGAYALVVYAAHRRRNRRKANPPPPKPAKKSKQANRRQTHGSPKP